METHDWAIVEDPSQDFMPEQPQNIEWERQEEQSASYETHEALNVVWGSDEYIPMLEQGVTEYDGSYEVTPLVNEEVTLPTRDKLMTDDVTVREVPIYEVSNDYGTTVYIATLED